MKIRNAELLRSISGTVIIAYDKPLYRLEKSGWQGNFIYIEHGLSPVKYYTYKYDFFFRSALIFYPGEIFKRKMKAVQPDFDRGLLGGFPRMDKLITMKIDRGEMCRRYSLDPAKPVILFAPSWGGKRSKTGGIRAAQHLTHIENLLIVPHSADYRLAKKYNAVIPENGDISPFLHLADVVVSDVSSVLAEGAIIGKPVVQLRLPSYPGCFPEKDKRKTGIRLSSEFIRREEENTDRRSRPFKIPYVDEDWDFGISAEPEKIEVAIREAVHSPWKSAETRKYWAEQSCWKADGHTCERIYKMIDHFLKTGERVQFE